MIISFFLLLFSILLIAKGSDFLTDSLVPLAKRWQTSIISLGLILVSVAVSLPEIFVSVFSALKGFPDLGLGVVLGSVVVNIGLMIGISAILKPLRVTLHMILRDGIFSIVVPILVLSMSGDGVITRSEGLTLFLLFIPYLANVFLQERKISLEEKEVLESHSKRKLSLVGFQLLKLSPGGGAFILGIGLLLTGAQIFSDQLINIARISRMGDIFTGLVIGAIGTSIPNIASSISATKKGLTEVAVSETLGSNIFTLLVTLGTLALVRPVVVSSQWIIIDIPLIILMSLLFFLFMLSGRSISKREGYSLLFSYFLIVALQIIGR